MMMNNMVQLGATLPDGSKGAILTLSQSPCNDPTNPGACCNAKGSICAAWAGAHLVSAGCIQYGVLELEASFSMPPTSGAFYFTALYIVNGGSDPAWNELDMGFINNVLNQLEYHATAFTASYLTPTATLMDALNFAGTGIGPSTNVNTTIRTINGVAQPQVAYNTSFGSTFHTYKLVWTPTSVAWLVDKTVYRNTTYAPWRPMGIRQILRTNKGINAVGQQYGDSKVYIRRIRYTPYSATAVADAYRCTSMFACYGPLSAAPLANATVIVSVAASAPPVAAGRRLLQNGAVASYGASALNSAVAAAMPGVVSSTSVISSQPAAYGLQFDLSIGNLCSAPGAGDAMSNFQQNGVQFALIGGLDQDLIPPAELIYVQSVTADSATGCNITVNMLITGYNATTILIDYAALNVPLGGAALLNSALAINNAVGAVTNTYITSGAGLASDDPNYTPVLSAPAITISSLLLDNARCPNYPATWDASCVDPNSVSHTVWCDTCVLLNVDSLTQVITYSVSVLVPVTAVDSTETALNAALFSNTIDASAALSATPSGRHLLQAMNTTVSVSSPNALLATRVAASQAAATAVPAASSAPTRRAGAALAALAAALVLASA